MAGPRPSSPASPGDTAPELGHRVPRLLETMETIGGDAELHTTLERIVTAAAELTGARYAALAVLNEDGSGVGEFVTHGVAPHVHQAIGRRPGRTGLIRALLEATEATGAVVLDDLVAEPGIAGFPPGQSPMSPLVGVPVRVHGAGYGTLYLADKRAGHFTPDDLQIMRVLASEAGIAVGNARLHEAVRQQARWMDGSLELSTSLLSEDATADHALAVVAEQARRLANAAAAVVLEPTRRSADGATAGGRGPGGGRGARRSEGVRGPAPSGHGLEVVAVSADEPGGLLGTVVSAGSPTLRRVLDGEPVFVDDPAEPAAEPFVSPDIRPEITRRYGPHMALPLASDGTILGVLTVARDRGGAPFSVPARALATQFAQQAALALVLARARIDREQLAVLQDRDRIARDLHDLVIQRLFAVGMLLEGAQRASAPHSPDIAGRIGSAVGELDATIQEIRTAIFALQQPPDDVPRGLRTRVLRETGAAAQTLGFTPSVNFVGAVDARVPQDVAGNLIAALREGLSNAARHARPTRIEVVVTVGTRTDGPAHTAAEGETTGGRAGNEAGSEAGEEVRLSVADNGVGLPEGGAAESGLRNLRRRAEELGGTATLGPGLDGTGTTLTWRVPI